MTNHQCFCYAIIAINNLKKSGLIITKDALFYEMYHLWDIYSEEEIEKLYSNMVETGKILN